MSHSLNRRELLAGLGGAGLASVGLDRIHDSARASSPNEKWTGGDWALLPEDRFRDLKPPHASVPRAPEQSHHQEWLGACRGGPPAFCRFDGFAARLTETMLVANLALRTGKKLRWDAETMATPGCPGVAPFIKRDYRTEW